MNMSDELQRALSIHLDAYEDHLRLGRGRSEHTIRAYVGDARSLLEHLAAQSTGTDLEALDLRVLRSWLAQQSAAGTARTTVARRASSARGFTAWLARTARIDVDPGVRLAAPPARRTLPVVLRQNQAIEAMEAAESGAQQHDPVALRDRLIVELLYSTGIRVGELCGLDIESVDANRRLLRVPVRETKSDRCHTACRLNRPSNNGSGSAGHCWYRRNRAMRCCWESAVGGSINDRRGRWCTRPSQQSLARLICRRTVCGIRQRHICWKVERTYASYKSCWGMQVWRLLSCTPTSRWSVCAQSTIRRIREPEKLVEGVFLRSIW